jgi:long-chain acyl-CoA synthetase
MCFAMRAASTMVMIPNPRDLKDVLDNLQKYKASIYPGVPAMYNGLNNHPDVLAKKYDLSSIKACISGSAPLLRETKEKFEALTGGKLGHTCQECPRHQCNPLWQEPARIDRLAPARHRLPHYQSG